MSCKLLENIIHSNVIEHLEHYNIRTDAQHRFWSKWAWETQLIKSVNDLVKISNNGEQIDSISKALYFKAFDRVPCSKLYLKLQHNTIRGKLLKYIENFLFNWTQKVVVSGEKCASVISDVPQRDSPWITLLCHLQCCYAWFSLIIN